MMRNQSNEQAAIPSHVNSVSGVELIKAKGVIEQFIYSCSHTLRGPLKSITGIVNLFKNKPELQELDFEFLMDSIKNSVTKMETVLGDLEKFMANSKQIITSRPVWVKTVVADALSSFHTRIVESGIEVTVKIHQRLVFHTDRNRLDVILSHVLLNAIQYQDETKGCPRIVIHCKVSSTRCLIQIKDNGVGIGADVYPYIFRLFYRGSEKSTGAGVGLYIVREVLNTMGGTIKIRSQHGVGTTVFILIPNLTGQ